MIEAFFRVACEKGKLHFVEVFSGGDFLSWNGSLHAIGYLQTIGDREEMVVFLWRALGAAGPPTQAHTSHAASQSTALVVVEGMTCFVCNCKDAVSWCYRYGLYE